jgi:hypothetical protein
MKSVEFVGPFLLTLDIVFADEAGNSGTWIG